MTRKKPAITVPTRDLHDLLSPVLPFAGTDMQFPVLNAVLIEVRDGWITATTTDRFRAGFCRLPYRGDTQPENFRAALTLHDAKHLLSLFRRSKEDTHVTLTIDDETLRASHGGGLQIDFADLQVSYLLLHGEYPKMGALFSKSIQDARSEAPAQPTNLNAEMLSAFKVVAPGRAAGVVIQTTGQGEKGGPLLVRVGDHFFGLLMNRRLDPAAMPCADLGEWEAFFDPEQSTPAPATDDGQEKVA